LHSPLQSKMKSVHTTIAAAVALMSTSVQVATAFTSPMPHARVSSAQCMATLDVDITKPAITKEQRIEFVKNLMESSTGYYSPMDESLLAEDFIFRGPVIGPLNTKDYKEVLGLFKVYEAFEDDLSANAFGFHVDPKDPRRVWFKVRASGTLHGEARTGLVSKVIAFGLDRQGENANKQYQGNTETWSIIVDDDMKMKHMSAGYVVDRFETGTTSKGKGLSFGVFQTAGLDAPFTAGPALQIIQRISAVIAPTGLLPRAYSADVPSWWKDERKGADP